VVARQHFTCCQSCGHAEIGHEIAQALQLRGAAGAILGYAFYHWQDTESAVDDGTLCLAYGATRDGKAAALEVGHSIVRALKEAGLSAEWDGDLGRRIVVKLDWKRRRTVDG